MSERAKGLSQQINALADEVVGVVQGCSRADWGKRCSEDWPLGVTARHIAAGHFEILGLVKSLVKGEPPPAFTREQIIAMANAHAREHAGCTPEEVAELMRRNGASMADYVAGLKDHELDCKGQFAFIGAEMSVQQIWWRPSSCRAARSTWPASGRRSRAPDRSGGGRFGPRLVRVQNLPVRRNGLDAVKILHPGLGFGVRVPGCPGRKRRDRPVTPVRPLLALDPVDGLVRVLILPGQLHRPVGGAGRHDDPRDGRGENESDSVAPLTLHSDSPACPAGSAGKGWHVWRAVSLSGPGGIFTKWSGRSDLN